MKYDWSSFNGNLIADVVAPDYLDGSLAGDYGWDPLGLGANKERLDYYRQGELQNGRWASKLNLQAWPLPRYSKLRWHS